MRELLSPLFLSFPGSENESTRVPFTRLVAMEKRNWCVHPHDIRSNGLYEGLDWLVEAINLKV